MKRRLTKTQRIILEAAAKSPTGSVQFGAGDRRGTRVAKFNALGTPIIIAYCTPEHFLQPHYLVKANEPYTYKITDAGRAAVAL